MTDWILDRSGGTAAELHAGSADLVAHAVPPRTIRILEPTDRAVVLGSAEPDSHVDRVAAALAGLDVCRRRSGGSAVLVGADDGVWVDVAVPAGDPRWSDDVGRAAWWVGDWWVAALADVGVPAATWTGPMRRGPWSDRVCFGGLGPGEVVAAGSGPAAGGGKLVGLSQRRTRNGALFQCAVPKVWRPAELLAVLDLDPARRVEAARDLSGAAAAVGSLAGPLVEAFVARAATVDEAPPPGRMP